MFQNASRFQQSQTCRRIENPTYINQSNINHCIRTKLPKKFLLIRGRYYREFENVLRSIVLGTLQPRESVFEIESFTFLQTITITNNNFNYFNYPYKIAKETVPNPIAINSVPFSQTGRQDNFFRRSNNTNVSLSSGMFEIMDWRRWPIFVCTCRTAKTGVQVDTKEERDARYHHGLVNFRRAASERASAKDDGNNKGLKGQEDRVRADRGRKGGATSAMAWKREAKPLASSLCLITHVFPARHCYYCHSYCNYSAHRNTWPFAISSGVVACHTDDGCW